jgi:hypothetical protein
LGVDLTDYLANLALHAFDLLFELLRGHRHVEGSQILRRRIPDAYHKHDYEN